MGRVKKYTTIKQNPLQVTIQNYNPLTDFQAVRNNLLADEMFDDNWDAEEKLQKLVAEKPNAILVAQVGNEIVGSVFQTDRLYPYFWRLVVRKDYRERGIGDQLLDAVEQQLRAEGHNQVGIFVTEEHEEVKQWYIKRGYQQTGLYRAMWKEIKGR